MKDQNCQFESYRPISDYGVIGNSRTAALVSNKGGIDWCCLPRFDSESIFSRILDSKLGGCFEISPVDEGVSQQSYVGDTNVLQTTHSAGAGEAVVTDAFTATSESRKRNRFWPDHEILRIIEGVSGKAKMRMEFRPRLQYGKSGVKLSFRKGLGVACSTGKEILLLQSSLKDTEIMISEDSLGSVARAEFEVAPGEKVYFSLIYSDEAPALFPPLGEAAQERMQETLEYWKTWIGRCRYEGPYASEVRRSALVLKLMAFAPSGAIVAAPTAGLPEWIGGARNWDYRYCWLRDASFTVRCLLGLGYEEEAGAFVSWMMHSTQLSRPKLQVLYSVYGHSKLKEWKASWLEGYKRSSPVRLGNSADSQSQLDVYGEVLDAIYAYSPSAEEIDRDTRQFIQQMGKAVLDLWDSPDNGIWEIRSDRAQHTHSKVMAWVALDRLEKLHKRFKWKESTEEIASAAQKIKRMIEERGYNSKLQSYTRDLDGESVDASLLILPLVGYCSSSDPRMVNTCRTIEEELGRNDLLYRYRGIDDGLSGEEGTFGICNFWMAENHAKAGRIDDAIRWMEGILSHTNELGLFSEEFHPETFEYLGNYPQAFTHIGLISAALTLQEQMKRKRAA